ncbi:MAG: hypothetical protein ACI9JN_000334 [Bacteroidia bacterium]|jgi:hypothetical protein
MRKLLLISIICLGSFNYLFAQEVLLNYEWEDDPSIFELTDEESKESAVYIKQVNAVEMFYDANGNALEYYMRHVIIHLNDAEAVDQNNKVYMTGSNASPDLYTIVEKARVIKTSGKIIEFDQEDILEETSEEDDRTLRYFAFEGIEIGDEIEYYHVYPRSPTLYGNFYRMQSEELKREATVIIVSPSNLEHRFTSWNNFPEMTKDSTYDQNYYSATAYNLKGLDESEAFASYHASRAGIAYYLYKNTSNGKTFDFYSTMSSYLARTIDEIDPKKSGLLKLMKKMEIDESLSDEDKIRYVENYVKKNFVYLEKGIADLGNLKLMIKRKFGNDMAFTRLFAGIFKELDITFSLAYTCDRDDFTFLEDFKCQLFLQEGLFYFPETKKYMAPVGLNTRYGFPPGHFTNNLGLFTRFMNIGGAYAGIGKVKYIKAVSADETVDEFTIKLVFDELPNTRCHFTRELTGYDALNYQFYFDLMDEEGEKELRESLVKYIDEEMELEEVKLTNIAEDDFGKKPMKVEADFVSQIFVKKAGQNYLINVGKMIGPQSDLYDEGERQMAVSNRFNRKYKRTLIVEVPDGYELANLENLNFDIQFDKDGKKDMGFTSSYTLVGNILTVIVEEYYYTIDYPIEEYENFEKQINAAADFNKVTILLKKS